MNRPHVLLVLTAVLWSLGGLFIKLTDWNALSVAGARSAIAAGVVWLLLPHGKIRLTKVVLAGALAYSATVITFVAATKWTTAANAIFLQFTAPLYVAVFGSYFLGEKTSKSDWARMGLAQVGILLFFIDGLSWGGTTGNLLGLLSGFAFACLILLLRKQKDANPIDSVLIGNLLTAAICLPFMFGPLPSMKTVLAIVFLGVFQLGLSYVLYTSAIKHVRALPAVLIGMIEPVLNPIWVLIVLGEKPRVLALIGGGMVVAAAVLQGWASTREPD
jgi:drug/metabolite transporter (DMT)-like permease